MTQIRRYKFLLIIIITAFYSCNSKPGGNVRELNELPVIDPDYTDVTVPANIAPLNFKINEKGSAYLARFTAESGTEIEVTDRKGIIRIPLKKWKKMLNADKGHNFSIDVFLKNKEGTWSKYKTVIK